MKKKNQYNSNALSMAVLLMIMLMSTLIACGPSEEEKQVAELLEKAESSASDNKVENTALYLIMLVDYQQEFQRQNPKKMDIALIESALEFANSVSEAQPEAQVHIMFSINKATLTMLRASYYSEKGDILKATTAVGEAVGVFDALVEQHPRNAYVRAYRGLNYSKLPDIFAKEAIINEDFLFLLQYFSSVNVENLRKEEQGFYPIALSAAMEFYAKQEETENAALAKDLLQELFPEQTE